MTTTTKPARPSYAELSAFLIRVLAPGHGSLPSFFNAAIETATMFSPSSGAAHGMAPGARQRAGRFYEATKNAGLIRPDESTQRVIDYIRGVIAEQAAAIEAARAAEAAAAGKAAAQVAADAAEAEAARVVAEARAARKAAE